MLNQLRQISLPTAIALCVALVAIWGSGAHAHRKADHHHEHASSEFGFEVSHHDLQASASSPASGHPASDDGLAHPPHALTSTGVEDVQLLLLKPSPGKLPSLDLLSLVLFLCVLSWRVLPRGKLIEVREGPPRPLSRVIHLRPPLRGPPLFSVA